MCHFPFIIFHEDNFRTLFLVDDDFKNLFHLDQSQDLLQNLCDLKVFELGSENVQEPALKVLSEHLENRPLSMKKTPEIG